MSLDPERCVTCSDEAVTATVVAVEGANATVEADGRREQVGIELVEPVQPGDVLLCHAGIALEKVP
jgi:hydrogenase maturation factor